MKRIVISHQNGLRQIVGLTDENGALALVCNGPVEVNGALCLLTLEANFPRHFMFRVAAP